MAGFPDAKFFKSQEFDSPDEPGSGEKMEPDFVMCLDALRLHCGFPFKISSGYRTKAHNALVGGTDNSAHLLGRAADIACGGEEAYTILKNAPGYGFTGIGIKQHGEGRLVHLDNVKMGEIPGVVRPIVWTYK